MNTHHSFRKVIFITGMSGTGKTTCLQYLHQMGYPVVDTDHDDWSEWVELPDGSLDWVLRGDKIKDLLHSHKEGVLFIAGCKTNQGKFYSYFDEIVLLCAPTEILRKRIMNRTNNPYGKSEAEWSDILRYIVQVEPLLRRSATVEIDTNRPVDEVVHMLVQLAMKKESDSCR